MPVRMIPLILFSVINLFNALNRIRDFTDIDEENISRENLIELTGGFTIPQIVINDKPIGGFEQLLILNRLVYNQVIHQICLYKLFFHLFEFRT